jgi:hypothetical protein
MLAPSIAISSSTGASALFLSACPKSRVAGIKLRLRAVFNFIRFLRNDY